MNLRTTERNRRAKIPSCAGVDLERRLSSKHVCSDAQNLTGVGSTARSVRQDWKLDHNLAHFVQALIWNAGYVRLFVTVVTSWWLDHLRGSGTLGNAYFAVITFTTVGSATSRRRRAQRRHRVDGVGVDAAARTQVPPPRHDVCGRRGSVPPFRGVVVVGSRVAGAAPESARRAPPEAPLEGHRPRRRRRAGHAPAPPRRRLPRPAARAAGEWWIARRLACIFDVGVTVSGPDRLAWLVSYSSLTITKTRRDSQRLGPQRCIYVRARSSRHVSGGFASDRCVPVRLAGASPTRLSVTRRCLPRARGRTAGYR